MPNLLPALFKIIAVVCAAGTSHDDCWPGSDALVHLVEGPQCNLDKCPTEAQIWFADYASRNKLDVEGRTIVYFFPVVGVGRPDPEPTGSISPPEFKKFD